MESFSKPIGLKAIDSLIAAYDHALSQQLDAIIHHPDFQHLEAAWRGLAFVIGRADFQENIQISILNCSKNDLANSFRASPELNESGFFLHVYEHAYARLGVDPYSVIIATYEIENTPEDIGLLRHASQVAAQSLCPFIASVGASFFGVTEWDALQKIPDLLAHMEGEAFSAWNAFRDTAEARFVGLILPRFLLRPPHRFTGKDGENGLVYEESVAKSTEFLWGHPGYVLSVKLAQSFVKYGLVMPIHVDRADRTVEDLPLHPVPYGSQRIHVAPEIFLHWHLNFTLTNLGFVTFVHPVTPDMESDPIQFGTNNGVAEFSGAYLSSAYRSPLYEEVHETAQSRIKALLPFVFFGSRFMHYLQAIAFEMSCKNLVPLDKLGQEFATWLQNLVTEEKSSSAAQTARYSLCTAEAKMIGIKPSGARAKLSIVPVFQIQGLDAMVEMESSLHICEEESLTTR